MSAASGPAMNAMRDVRHSAAAVSALCDSVILGRRMDAAIALSKLPGALRLLIARAQRALDALEREP